MSNDQPTVRFAYAATSGEITHARDFDGVDTITIPTARLRELYAELDRLRALVASAERIFAHFGGLGELAKWENAGGESAAALVAEYQREAG